MKKAIALFLAIVTTVLVLTTAALAADDEVLFKKRISDGAKTALVEIITAGNGEGVLVRWNGQPQVPPGGFIPGDFKGATVIRQAPLGWEHIFEGVVYLLVKFPWDMIQGHPAYALYGFSYSLSNGDMLLAEPCEVLPLLPDGRTPEYSFVGKMLVGTGTVDGEVWTGVYDLKNQRNVEEPRSFTVIPWWND